LFVLCGYAAETPKISPVYDTKIRAFQYYVDDELAKEEFQGGKRLILSPGKVGYIFKNECKHSS